LDKVGKIKTFEKCRRIGEKSGENRKNTGKGAKRRFETIGKYSEME
jgi:hypothetical protein